MGKSKIETIKEEHKLSANRATGSGQKVESFKYTESNITFLRHRQCALSHLGRILRDNLSVCHFSIRKMS